MISRLEVFMFKLEVFMSRLEVFMFRLEVFMFRLVTVYQTLKAQFDHLNSRMSAVEEYLKQLVGHELSKYEKGEWMSLTRAALRNHA